MPEPEGDLKEDRAPADEHTDRPIAGDHAVPVRPGLRLALFAAGLIVALLGGFGIGRAVEADQPAESAASHAHAGDAARHDHAAAPAASSDAAGLAVSAGGYTLVADTTTYAARTRQPFTFRVVGPDGSPVTRFEVAHEKQLHLIVARRDLTSFQHLHPELGGGGTWTVPLVLPTPGSYRAYADFVVNDPAGRKLAMTLAVDLTVPGDYRPDVLPAPARDTTADGFTVSLEGAPRVGATQPLLARVTAIDPAAGLPDLERYLGSYGHLVVLRDGDLAYLHVHPEEQLAGGAVKFWVAAPSPGRYRAFFDFQVAGVVHTAAFTINVA